eukprot:762159-Pyramimonas_sp.AAC.4
MASGTSGPGWRLPTCREWKCKKLTSDPPAHATIVPGPGGEQATRLDRGWQAMFVGKVELGRH